ncbi:GGDEF domain-containing protein [Solibacillus sp. CAU 1738]|uniref:GGDEF domain-containing protein n=1 Tax=Solibacillus sp. CAU 1738 TaxID=3140363 RepID=UPI003260051D
MDPYELRMILFEHNRNKVKLISYFMLPLLGFILCTNIYAYTKWDNDLNNGLWIYVFPYVFLIIIFLSAAILCKTPLEKLQGKRRQIGPILIKFIIFFMLFFGAIITFYDQIHYFHQMVYPFILLICLSFIVLPRKEMQLIIFTNTGFLIAITLIFRDLDKFYLMHILFLLVLSAIGLTISSANYNSFRASIITQIEMKKEMELSRQLAQELQQAISHLEQLAIVDPLTNIPNRLAYTRYISSLENLTKQAPIRLTTMIIDIDNFKQFNDYYGHIKGDVILKKFGNILREVGQGFDVFIARWGGEEFVALLVNETDEQVETFCKNLMGNVQALNIPHEKSPVSNQVTISIGAWTQWAHNQTDIDIAMSMADTMLYEVKSNGRNHYKIKSQM